jgi:ribosomal protein S14
MRQQIYLKDNKKRHYYEKIEITQKILKVLSFYQTDEFFITRVLKKLFVSNFSKNHFKTCIKNYCIITGRSRGIYKKMRVSRIFFRQLGSEGFFFGLKKASW